MLFTSYYKKFGRDSEANEIFDDQNICGAMKM